MLFKNKQLLSCGLLAAVILTGACACQGGSKDSGPVSSKADQIVRPLADDTVILEYNGGKITAKDVGDMATPQIKRMSEEAIETYQQAARRMLVQRLIMDEAKKKNLSPQQLMESAVASPTISDAEADKFLASRPELKKGVKNPRTGKIEKVSREDAKHYLEGMGRQNAQQTFVENLMSSANVRTVLDLPRAKIEANPASPSFGSKNAKVTIYEFSDFLCPYCQQASKVVHQIKDAYGDKVNFQFRHFVVHPPARSAHEAAVCATEQGKFWDFHDKIFGAFEEHFAATKEGDDKVKKLINSWADASGLDKAKFEACLKDTKKLDSQIAMDKSAGDNAGVSATPTFFVNGKRVAGALSFGEFKSMIDSELSKN